MKASQSPDRSNREAAVVSLLGYVKRVAETSGSRKGQRVARFLTENSRVAVPILGNSLHYDAEGTGSRVFIAPIMMIDAVLPSIDKHVNEFSQPARTDGPSGVYVYGSRTIYVAMDWPISRFWLALTLLHEGQHALDHVTGRADRLPVWQQERRAQALECSVVTGIYGIRLKPVLDDLTSALHHAAELGDPGNFLWPGDIDQKLARVFGQPRNVFDCSEQRAAVRTLASYHYLQAIQASTTMWRAGLSHALERTRELDRTLARISGPDNQIAERRSRDQCRSISHAKSRKPAASLH